MSIHVSEIEKYSPHPALEKHFRKTQFTGLRQPERDGEDKARADAVDQLYADVGQQNKLAVVMHDARLDSMDRRLHAQGLVILCLIIVIAAIIFVLVSLQYRFSQFEGRGMETIRVVPLTQSAPITSFASTRGGSLLQPPSAANRMQSEPPLVTFTHENRVGQEERTRT